MEIIIGGVLVFLGWIWAHIGLLLMIGFVMYLVMTFISIGEKTASAASDLSDIRFATKEIAETLERIEHTLDQIESNTDRLPQIAPWEPGGIANPL